VNYFGAECQLFWSEVSIILESVICFWSGVLFVENKGVTSLVSPNIEGCQCNLSCPLLSKGMT
jgi:hypothetical protein